MTWRPEEFEDLGGELRRRIGAEIREEAEEVERLADLQRRRRQSLPVVAQQAMHRGDRVTLRLGARIFEGFFVAVGDDYLRLETSRGTVEAPLSSCLISLASARAGGRSGRPDSMTWRARLAELAADEVDLQLMLLGTDEEFRVRIEIVSTDHIAVADLGETGRSYIPLAMIAAVIASPRT